MASAAGTRPLQTVILQKCSIADEDINASLISWTSLAHTPANLHECSQRVWDSAVVDQSFQTLFNSQSEPYHRARLLAAAAIHSGDWLHALPIFACGLRLNDEAVRVAVGLRLGTDICQPHQCVCGSIVDVRGSHALSCKRNAGRIQRHHHINDLIWRAMSRAGIAAVKEPHGLTRSDGKRPDGLTLIPWRDGRCATWDVTVTDTTAVSYIATTSSLTGSAAEAAALRKEAKYTDLSHSYCFFPLAFETMGPINVEGLSFLSQLGHRISTVTEDPREISFLFQRISIVIQRFNAVCLNNTFSHVNGDSAGLPDHI